MICTTELLPTIITKEPPWLGVNPLVSLELSLASKRFAAVDPRASERLFAKVDSYVSVEVNSFRECFPASSKNASNI